jgi:hypothetical protein
MKDELASLQATNSKLEVKNAFLEQALEEARSMLIETPVHTEAHKELSAKLFRANQVCIYIYTYIQARVYVARFDHETLRWVDPT